MQHSDDDLRSRLRGLRVARADEEEAPFKIRVRREVSSDKPVASSPAVSQPKPQTAAKKQATSAPQRTKLPDEFLLNTAVDEIARQNEADNVALEDTASKPFVGTKPSIKQRIRQFLVAWWRNKKARYGTFAGLAVVLIALFAFPLTRYGIMGAAGFRGSVQIRVLDETNNEPLKNVVVTIGDHSARTNSKGTATLQSVHLGRQTVRIEKIAFAPLTRTVTVGMGTTKIPLVSLRAVGVQYHVLVRDYVSGKAIPTAEAVSGEANANANNTGKIVLTMKGSEAAEVKISIIAKGYREETVSLKTNSQTAQVVRMVPDKKTVFISNQRGTYDVFASYIDGKEKQMLLEGTGIEDKSKLSLSISPDGTMAALASTRDKQKAPNGFLLTALTLINIETQAATTIEHAERVNVVGWAGDSIVYEKVVSGVSAANPGRSRIIAYNYTKNARNQLASANYFNGALVAKSVLYYATSGSDPSKASSFYKVNVSGSGRQTVLSKQIWTMVQTGYDTILLQTPDEWYSYKIGSTAQPSKTTTPGDMTPRAYVDHPDGAKSLWVQVRDGRGALLLHNNQANTDKTIKADEGLTYPVRWLTDDIVVYRISSSTQSTDYALSLKGGSSKKITDVTTTY